MNILSITYEYAPIGGGGGVVAAALNEHLAEQGHRVRVVTSRMRGLPARERIGGVEVRRVRCWRRHRHYTTAPELATTLIGSYRAACEMVRAERPDLIHAHFVVPSGWVARRVARRFRIPYVLTAHGSDIPGYNPDRFANLHRILAPAWRRIMADAAAITSPSAYLAGLVRRRIDLPIHVVPNGYSPGATQGREKRDLVLVVARLFPRKGVEHFIDAVRDLATEWELVIAGDGPCLAELKARAGGETGRIRFVGFVDKPTLRGLYEEARVMVFPSLRENFPMVLLEAMDAGCAVITTDAEGCAEVIGDAGLVVPKGDAAGIRDALRTLVDDSDLREELSRKASARVEQFRWPRLCTLYQDRYEAAFEHAGSRSESTFAPTAPEMHEGGGRDADERVA